MTKIGMSLGGKPAQAASAQGSVVRGPALDWTKAEYATPHPAPKRVYGRHVAAMATSPQLPERNIRVRAKPPATVYDDKGSPIPAEWVTVPISPSLIDAVARGDLERGADPDAEQPPPRRHHARASPTE